MNAAVIDLGCRLNQSEGDSLRRWLQEQGYKLEPAEADSAIRIPQSAINLVIVNTCCVTKEAERSSLQRIRRAARLQPKPHLIVTGCMAESDPARLRAIPGVDEVLGITEKEKLMAGRAVLPLRSRAFLKVQDGCDHGCTFCIVSILRRAPRSKPVELVRQEAAALLQQGFREIVLCGLNLGRYGTDCNTTLARLLAELKHLSPPFLLRLSSLEPETISDELLARISSGGSGLPAATQEKTPHSAIRIPQWLCPHFHLPLQSGDDGILHAMNRGCTADEYRATVRKVLDAAPEANIGTDVIVGFPGEDEAAFDRTRTLIEELPFGYLHVFSYSPRPGTASARLNDSVPRDVKRTRVTRLRELAAGKSLAYRRRFLNQNRPAILIRHSAPRTSHSALALTDNYISVQLDAPETPPGALIAVRITQVSTTETIGISAT